MPISECDGRPTSHWTEVLQIIETAAKDADFQARLVSDTFESNLIHKEILQNIYQDDIVVCDVSGRNPNVFFELGIRMATQLPTVIIKDDKTTYPFDTGPNRYIGYPRDLRHPAMERFKSELTGALKQTIQHKKEQSFIGHLGPFQIPDVESTKLPASDIILSRLDRMEKRMMEGRTLKSELPDKLSDSLKPKISFHEIADDTYEVCIRGYHNHQVDEGIRDFRKMSGSHKKDFDISHLSSMHSHVHVSGGVTQSEKFQPNFSFAIATAIPF